MIEFHFQLKLNIMQYLIGLLPYIDTVMLFIIYDIPNHCFISLSEYNPFYFDRIFQNEFKLFVFINRSDL